MNEDFGLFHITWVTYSSRISERMKKFGADKNLKPLILSGEDEINVTKFISNIVKEDNLKILVYNICADHVHLIIHCESDKRDNIVKKLKDKSTQYYKTNKNIDSEFHLWGQKYNYWTISNDEQLSNVFEYIKNNRIKHSLPPSKELKRVIEEMLTPYEKLFE